MQSKNSIVKDIEDILKSNKSTSDTRTLAVCFLELYAEIKYLKKLSWIQITLLGSLIISLITIALKMR